MESRVEHQSARIAELERLLLAAQEAIESLEVAATSPKAPKPEPDPLPRREPELSGDAYLTAADYLNLEFDPEDMVTRDAMAVMLKDHPTNLVSYLGFALSTFGLNIRKRRSGRLGSLYPVRCLRAVRRFLTPDNMRGDPSRGAYDRSKLFRVLAEELARPEAV